jgi:hypothetical protein
MIDNKQEKTYVAIEWGWGADRQGSGSQEDAGPPQVFLRPLGGRDGQRPALGGALRPDAQALTPWRRRSARPGSSASGPPPRARGRRS